MSEKLKREIVIDAKGSVVGRLATFAAKKALQGNNIIIVNSEEAIIIGRPREILKKYTKRFALGRSVQKGPLYPRKSEHILRRAIRGMIGIKKSRGREAFKRVKCYVGVPEKYEKAEQLVMFKKESPNFITLKRLSYLIRQK